MASPKVLIVTGTRADWSKMEGPTRAVLAAVGAASVFITGMHMLKEYGATKDIVKRLPGVDFIEFDNHGEGPDQTEVMVATMTGLKKTLEEGKFTDVFIHGDRVEAIAVAVVARQLEVRLHHIEGGEITGSIDNDYRYGVTAFATYHYVCTEGARQRVLSTGQPSDTVFNIGSPEMDAHARDYGFTIEAVKEMYGIPFAGEYGIVSFHSVTSEKDAMAIQAATLFATLETFGKPFVIIMPNNDPGTDDIRMIIEKILSSHRSELFFRANNIDFEHFSTLQKNAKLFIGNSSAGVREMPFHGVPSINVGSRQSGRAPNILSILNAPADDPKDLLLALEYSWGKKFPRDTTFGDGKSEEKLTKILRLPGHFTRPVQKTLSFRD